MFKLLVDTCVWLDLAKDHQQQSLLGVLETLIQQNQVHLILPRTVLDEFARNKARVIEDSGRSLSGVLKRVKEAVKKFGHDKSKKLVLDELDDVDHKIPLLGGAAAETVARIEMLFRSAPVIEICDDVKLRAAQRAVEKRAPFHRSKNSINDAILLEIYADSVRLKSSKGRVRFAFVTHNTADFSHPTGDNRLAHPEIASVFSKIRSLYCISLGEALRRVQPELVSDLMLEQEWSQETRRLAEILEAMDELLSKIWYDRHQSLRQKVESGKHTIVKNSKWTIKKSASTTTQEIWDGARKSARRVEEKYGKKNLGPWSKFEWGMLNGKLSALRWVLGDEWDMLDT